MIKFERLPEDILTKITEGKKVLFDDNNVIFAYLFGGLAEGKVTPLSDIDIAVFLKSSHNVVEYKLGLFDRLADSLGTSEIDLVILNTAPISLTGRILQKKQLIIDKDPPRRHVFESVSLRKFFDFKKKEDIYFLRRYGIGR
ncbi:MAG TPA: nucleotidyltransferase domain-containing protein [Thermodesulfovibrionales bacterium]|nr:nucleotidyltransferase domain-containing protein [Thermodesulfovibrionales bacterium]